jgi:GTP-binding protein Era
MSEETGEFRAGMVTLIGRPNVGKSTLMNHVLGEKVAITTSKPQTTRNRILGVRTWPERGQLCFVDTPGLHDATKRLNKALVQTALDALADVDVVCHVIDAAAVVGADKRGEGERIRAEEELVLEKLEDLDVPRIAVLNKVDKVHPKERLLPILEEFWERGLFDEIVPCSALTGDNVDRLVDVLLELVPEGPPLFPEDMLTDKAERFLAAEYVREQVMVQTRKEIPYAVAVEIDRFVEKDDVIEISAVIHVERSSQKGIIIGEGGSRIKEIGTRARQELESFFHKKVFLETFVRVESEWSENPRALSRFGYE